MKNEVEYLLSHFSNMHVFSMLISEFCASATIITAESFPFEYVHFPTPRGIANIYFDSEEVQKPLYATVG